MGDGQHCAAMKGHAHCLFFFECPSQMITFPLKRYGSTCQCNLGVAKSASTLIIQILLNKIKILVIRIDSINKIPVG